MITKKRVNRMVKLFDSLRGPKKTGVIMPMDKFRKTINTIDLNDINITIHSTIYQTFYDTVMHPNTYFTQKILDDAIRFFEENIRSIWQK